MKKLAIITGTSRGLGFYLAQYFLESGYTVIGIARGNKIKNDKFYFFKSDLSKNERLQEKFTKFIKQKKISLKNDHIVLINNAATILPIGGIQKHSEKDILTSYFLNLHSPILLSQYILKTFFSKASQCTICNISSGAALRPFVDWSMYCTMKAGLKMFSDCLTLDNFDQKNKFKCISFYPGIMDTQMQTVIRSQKENKFKNVEVFKNYKKNNQLLNPDGVAKKLFILLNSPVEITKNDYDISEL